MTLLLYCWWSRYWSICVEFTPFVPKWFSESSCCPFRQVQMFTRCHCFSSFSRKTSSFVLCTGGKHTHLNRENLIFSPEKIDVSPIFSGQLSQRFDGQGEILPVLQAHRGRRGSVKGDASTSSLGGLGPRHPGGRVQDVQRETWPKCRWGFLCFFSLRRTEIVRKSVF